MAPRSVVYRLTTKEVLDISNANFDYPQADTDFNGVVQDLADGAFPDGFEHREMWQAHVLGVDKYWDTVGSSCRNATQLEIDTFDAGLAEEENEQDLRAAKRVLDVDPVMRKLMVAFADVLKDEFNIVRGWTLSFKAEVAAANNLGDLQTRVATLPDLPDRTLTQLKTALRNRMSKDD